MSRYQVLSDLAGGENNYVDLKIKDSLWNDLQKDDEKQKELLNHATKMLKAQRVMVREKNRFCNELDLNSKIDEEIQTSIKCYEELRELFNDLKLAAFEDGLESESMLKTILKHDKFDQIGLQMLSPSNLEKAKDNVILLEEVTSVFRECEISNSEMIEWKNLLKNRIDASYSFTGKVRNMFRFCGKPESLPPKLQGYLTDNGKKISTNRDGWKEIKKAIETILHHRWPLQIIEKLKSFLEKFKKMYTFKSSFIQFLNEDDIKLFNALNDLRDDLSYWKKRRESLRELKSIGEMIGEQILKQYRSNKLKIKELKETLEYSYKMKCKQEIESDYAHMDDWRTRKLTCENFRSDDKEISAKHKKSVKQIVMNDINSKYDEERFKGLSVKVTEAIENGKKMRKITIRDIMCEHWDEITTFFPCMLADPVSVAKYIPPKPFFDYLLFDEASQITPPDAIGSIARLLKSKGHFIMCGDKKQLPPTTFFRSSNTTGEDDENKDEPMESILDQAIRSGKYSNDQLKWHYRSEDPSLIEFSNHHFYKDELIVLPVPYLRGTNPDKGVKFVKVDGDYNRNGKRKNSAEAKQVVDELVRILVNTKDTVGVIAFNNAQAGLIDTMVTKRLDEMKTEMSEEQHERIKARMNTSRDEKWVFIKSIETVQGDERDVILLSLTYMFDRQSGKLSTFGPLNKHGGEKRLNVAVTRAKKRLVVFSSMKSEDIRITNEESGVSYLKKFIKFAENFAEESHHTNKSHHASKCRLTEKIRGRLIAEGWRVDSLPETHLLISLAVASKAPSLGNQHLLGLVFTGGEKEARLTSARSREILTPALLEKRGWKLYNVHARNWCRDFNREYIKLNSELENLEKNLSMKPKEVIEIE